MIVLIAEIIAKKERQASLWLELAHEQKMKIVQLSYDHLEDHLKPWLLYVGLFPEDYKFQVCELLKFLIAEGIIQHKDLERMQEISKSCLIDPYQPLDV